MNRRIVLALACALAAAAPAPADAMEVCVDVTVNAPFLFTHVNRCVNVPPATPQVCHTRNVIRPPFSVIVTICVPDLPAPPPPPA
jgi:hypothetical protein